MSRFLFILANEDVRMRVMGAIRRAPIGWRVHLKEPKRTLEQNDKMWAMLTDVAEQCRHHGRAYTTDQWKVLFMHDAGREVQFLPALDGSTFVPYGQSSSDLSKAEMSAVIESMYRFGAEQGVVWTEPVRSEGGGGAKNPAAVAA